MNIDFNQEKINFSILMPNYNNESYIEEAIKSVLDQTYSDWELIIVDDFSSDQSINIIHKFLKDSRIKLYHNQKNLGAPYSLRIAISKAKFEFIILLDSDDKLTIDALEKVANCYKKYPYIGFVHSTHLKCNKYLKNCRINKTIKEVIPKKTNIFQFCVSHLKSFKKSAYNLTSGFDPFVGQAYDQDIILKLEEVTEFKFINKPLYYYRLHGKGMSHRRRNYLYRYLAIQKAYLRRINTNLPNFTKKQLIFYYLRIKSARLRKKIINSTPSIYFQKFLNKHILLKFLKLKIRRLFFQQTLP